MHHIACLLFSLAVSWPLVAGQFSLPGNDGSGYPRIKLAGPLGQLISGQGLSLNSGFGQVLSNLINNAAGGSSGSSGGGGPLSQLATAASTNYINAIRTALPFGQMGQSQGQQSSVFGSLGSPLASFLSGDSGSLYGGSGQSNGYENGHNYQSHYPGHYQGASENAYFGGHYGHGAYGHGHPGQAQGLFGVHQPYNSHLPAPVHHLDRK